MKSHSISRRLRTPVESRKQPDRIPGLSFRTLILTIIMLLFPVLWPVQGAPDASGYKADDQSQEYRIEQPGTITFTVGVKIKGKIEKPQVMIFLPKERTLYRKIDFTRSFSRELAEPLPFTPITE